ncbi:MAG: copper amine oxidase N-terminal domain-containing protein, partial [Defluviitaleaceae bacterium]|nr:copper amine oxidase N-terminal domain-containing protein [Defluviitaleaceae bacterium]
PSTPETPTGGGAPDTTSNPDLPPLTPRVATPVTPEIDDDPTIDEPEDDPPEEPRILRFVIGSTTYTVSGIPGTLDAPPFIENGRTMVPVRVVGEYMGAIVNWDSATRTVTIVKGGQFLSLPVDIPIPDGMGMPRIVADRTFVPIRYVSETLGAYVRWDEDAQAVYIYL